MCISHVSRVVWSVVVIPLQLTGIHRRHNPRERTPALAGASLDGPGGYVGVVGVGVGVGVVWWWWWWWGVYKQREEGDRGGGNSGDE